MLYKIGRVKDAKLIEGRFPDEVESDVLRGAAMRDSWYGDDRDFLEVGGYSLILDSASDLEEFHRIINYDTFLCDWVTTEGKSGYLCALYILNDDFTIDVFMPLAIAPEVLLNELED